MPAKKLKLPRGRSKEIVWRDMRSAPKDRLVLLAVPHSGGEDVLLVNFGRWTDKPYSAELHKSWHAGGTTNAEDLPRSPRWLACHVGIMDHGGACSGNTVEYRGYLVHPKYWAELPETPTK